MANPFDIAEASVQPAAGGGPVAENPFDVAERSLQPQPAAGPAPNPFDVAQASMQAIGPAPSAPSYQLTPSPLDSQTDTQGEDVFNPAMDPREAASANKLVTPGSQVIFKYGADAQTPQQQQQLNTAAADADQPVLPVSSTAGQVMDAAFAPPKPFQDIVDIGRGIQQNNADTTAAMRALAQKHGIDPDSVAPLPGKIQQILKGTGNSLVDLGLNFTSPGAIATMGFGGLPEAVQKAASLGFSAQMLSQTPEIARQIVAEENKPDGQRDDQKLTELYLNAFASAGFGTLAGAHGTGGAPVDDHAPALAPDSNIQPADSTKTQPAILPPEEGTEVAPAKNSQVGGSSPVAAGGSASANPFDVAEAVGAASDGKTATAPVLTADGRVDPVATAVQQLRTQGDQHPAIQQIDNLTAQLQDLRTALTNPFKQPEPAPTAPAARETETTTEPAITPASEEQPSPPAAATAPAAPAASETELPENETIRSENETVGAPDAKNGGSDAILTLGSGDSRTGEAAPASSQAELASNTSVGSGAEKNSQATSTGDLGDNESPNAAVNGNNPAPTGAQSLEGGTPPPAPDETSTVPLYKVGDQVMHDGKVKTVTKRQFPGSDFVGVGKRAVKVSELSPVPESTEQPSTIKAKADKLADSLESIKSGIGQGGQLHAFGVAAHLWDQAISVAQYVIREGGTVADAITAAFKHVRRHFDGDFDEVGARAALNEALTPKAAPERERTVPQVKSDINAAQTDLMDRLRDKGNPKTGGSPAEKRQAAALATAKLRGLQDELYHHPDYIAEQLARQHAAVTEANDILKPHGLAVHPEEFPDPNKLAAVLKPGELKRVNDLQNEIEQSHAEIQKMPPKMVARIYGEMQDDGRLPKAKPMETSQAGRTLSQMTDFLRANKFDSPKATLAERLAIGRKFADTYSGVKDAVSKAWVRAQAGWKGIVQNYKKPPADNDFRTVMKHWFNYDQRTGLENYRYVQEFKNAVPLAVRRKAMTVWLDAGGDHGMLEAERQQVPDQYKAIWDAAKKLTPDEKKIALQVKADFEMKRQDAVNTGLLKPDQSQDNYVPQRWKTPPQVDSVIAKERRGSAGNPYAKLDPRDPFFSFQRETPSYFEGIMAKGEPENLDLAHLVSTYDEGFHKALGSRGMVKALMDAHAEDGQPVVKVSGSATSMRGEGGATLVDNKTRPTDAVTADGRPYKAIDHFALRDWKVVSKDGAGNPVIVRGDMLVHPDHFRFLKNELDTPAWSQKDNQGLGEKTTRGALAAGSFLKASTFIGPFHIVTEALHAATHGAAGVLSDVMHGDLAGAWNAKGTLNPSVRGFGLDLRDPKQALLARNMTLGFGHAREMFEEGLGAHGGIWAKVPGLGRAVVAMNNFTFNEYIPRLKMKVGMAVLDRNTARYGKELSPEQIAEVTGRQMDAAFGGQNWRLLGANKTGLAIARMGLVAPDFLLSRSKVIAQAFKPYNNEQRLFLLAQAVGVYTLARVANTLLSDNHDPHFEAKNWDSVVIGKRAYHARFLVSDAAALARDLMGLRSGMTGMPFISGRMGVIPKIGIEALTGKDLFTGANKSVPFESHGAAKALEIIGTDVAGWMTPMAVSGFMPGAKAQGQSGMGSAIAATVGVNSTKQSAAGDIYDLADKWLRNSDDPEAKQYLADRDNDTRGPSKYFKLNNLLDAGDAGAAQKEYNNLVAAGTQPENVAAHYHRTEPFTGNQEREQAFVDSLTPKQQAAYQQAMQEHQARADAFDQLQTQ